MDFISFLIEQDAYNRFIRLIEGDVHHIPSQYNIDGFLNITQKMDYLVCAFIWPIDEILYWSDLNYKWHKICKLDNKLEDKDTSKCKSIW